jgi:uncharacterized protein (DUF2249 family)/quercetin dioxygenase-like cupin family protein
MPDLSVTDQLDVRPLAKPDKHPTIFAAYAALPVGGAFVLINDHDPRHLREEFEAEHPGSFGWEYLSREPRDWRIRITKFTATPLPRILLNTTTAAATEPELSGAAWKLTVRQRDLDANLIALPANGAIDRHAGPDLDVIIHVVAGSGELATESGALQLVPGDLVWLPARSERAFTAGSHGLQYLTVHQRRQALLLAATSRPVPDHADDGRPHSSR